MSEEYDLAKSESNVGQLYPILVDKDGNILDGFHREAANPNWKRLKLEHIDTEEKKQIARCVANWHRRQVTREEKEEWINGLAEIYKKQGLTITPRKNEIKLKIAEVVGIHPDIVLMFLDSAFKVSPKPYQKKGYPTKPASIVIEHQGGKELVERHREEVLQEETPKIENKVKQELLKDREFQREVLRELTKPKPVKVAEACPSGVCKMPSIVESGEPVDVRAEAITLFFKENPQCQCKTCSHYEKCGVIY